MSEVEQTAGATPSGADSSPAGRLLHTDPDQPLRALAQATLVRLYRCALRGDIRTGRQRLGDVIRSDDHLLHTMNVTALLEWLPNIGPNRAERLTIDVCSPFTRVGDLTDRQRTLLAARLDLWL